MTTVVSVKVKCIRPKYQNLKEWKDTNNVYIGRKGVVFINKERFPKQASIWANPFKPKDNSPKERQLVLTKYRKYIIQKLGSDLKPQLEKLEGKTLGCWCKDKYKECHGDVLVQLMKELLD